MEEWKEYKLKDVATLTTGFPFDGHKYGKFVLLEEIMSLSATFDGTLIKTNAGPNLLNALLNILYMRKILLLVWMALELERIEHKLKKKICLC